MMSFLFFSIRKGNTRKECTFWSVYWIFSQSFRYIQKVSTMFISLNYINHLIDGPISKTFINAYDLT